MLTIKRETETKRGRNFQNIFPLSCSFSDTEFSLEKQLQTALAPSLAPACSAPV